MFRKPTNPLTALTLAAFLATSILPAMPAAAASFDGMPDMRYNPYGAQARSGGTTAGVYIRMPFKGGLRRPTEEARVGFALSTRIAGQRHDTGRFAVRGTPRLIDLSFGLSGREPLAQSLRFNGMSFSQVNALYASEEGEDGAEGKGGKKKRSPVKTGLMVVGGLALAALALSAIAIAASDCGILESKNSSGECEGFGLGWGDGSM